VDPSTYLKYAGLDVSPLISSAHNWKDQKNSPWSVTASLQPPVSLGRSNRDEAQEYDLMMGWESHPFRLGTALVATKMGLPSGLEPADA